MKSDKRKISIKTVYAVIIAFFMIIGGIGLTLVFMLKAQFDGLMQSEQNFTLAVTYSEQIRKGSDTLTENSQNYVVLKDDKYLLEYWRVLNVEKPRTTAVERLRELGLTDEEEAMITEAMSYSNALIDDEVTAMHYILASKGITDMEALSAIQGEGFDDATRERILASEISGEAEEYPNKAANIIFGVDYQEFKNKINSLADSFNSHITERMESSMENSVNTSVVMLGLNLGLMVFMIIGVAAVLIVLYTMLVGPILGFKNSLANDTELNISGAAELSYLSEKYKKKDADFEKQRMRLEAENDLYRKKSQHDYLTNLVNREVLDEYLRNKFSDAENIPPFVLYMVDIDDFKKVNDTYGHDAGDRILKALAVSFKCVALKYGGLAARYGGEEFVVTAECIEESDVDQIAEELLQLVRKTQIIYGGLKIATTVSVGSCFSLTGGRDERTILLNADGAMYKSKARGKNCHNRFKNMIGANE